MFKYLNVKLQMFIPFNNSLTLKYPNQESILPRFVGSVLVLVMQVLVAFIQLLIYLYTDPLKYILG